MAALTTAEWLQRLRRSAKPESRGRVRILPRSIYILPTRQGVLLALLLVLMLAGSINYGSNLGHLMTFLLGGVWLVTILHTWRNLLGLSIQPGEAASVFAGQTADFTLRVVNNGGSSRYGIALGSKKQHGGSVDIPGNAGSELHIPVKTQRRGILPIPEITIQTTFPFGLFRAWSYARLDLSCLVYPKPAERGELPTLAIYNHSDSGDRGVGADDFIGLRSYRLGDSPRQIDWKAHARERGLLSKQFGGDRSEQVSLDWELLQGYETEERLSLLCRFILQAEEREQSYSLRMPQEKIPTGSGPLHQQRCLSLLARHGHDDETTG
ncbi:MAG: DUF58 domain-containing protein [Candidatus Thiodiazotropha sp. (ex Ctena orbiculata)]|nr:DUF58 domain-containing protein [Candidatus Thiodiazotropha taylori]MBT2997201.1 DUF58 domain-containing protein [Candidatus Thiodiazotropha taylori]MBT3001354.1 DUF58 domain-containing protein [Candidatus Thiodiazotropha taylori]MBV2107198.1 DUF58 domain-containing protein [Candidatus Thiodiazotropha taylori]MBV2111726.1 DUF58 domain-containing protein [Candidatus Thiodiazotropha taylori]